VGGKFTLATIFEAVDKLSGPVKTMEKNVSHMSEHAKNAMAGLKTIVAGAIAAFGAGEIIHQITEFAEKGDEISRTSRSLGMSAEALQKLRYAAKMADIPAETLTGALRKMSVNLGQLATRQGSLYTHLSRTNPALARQLYNTKDNNKAFLLLMDAINHTSNAQERAALTVAAFGKSGQDMLPLIMKGSGAIAAMGDEAKRLGLVMSDDAAKAGEKFHESLKRITVVGQGLLYNVLGKILEKMAPLLERFADWATKNDNLVRLMPKVLFAVGALIIMMGALDAVMDANPIGAVVVALEALALAAIFVVVHWNQIVTALRNAWNWFNKLFNNPWIRIALNFIAQPLLVIVGAIQTLVDLLSGKGWSSFTNMLGPWKALTDAVGLTHAGGQWAGGGASPAVPVSDHAHSGMHWNGHIWVHAGPGTGGVSGSPGGTPAPVHTLNMGWAATK
jgi:hypothetical protein